MVRIYFLLTFLPVVIDAAGCGTKTVGGTLDEGPYTNLDNNTTGSGYIATTYKLDCCGVLTGWNVLIKNMGTIILQVWRRSGSSYQLVTSNSYTFATADQLKLQILAIDPPQQHTIMAGDVIGWYTTAMDMVPYATGSAVNYQKTPGSASGTVNFATGNSLNGRDYAISLVTGDNYPPRFTTLPDKISFLDTKNDPAMLYTVTTTDDNIDDTTLILTLTTTPTLFYILNKNVGILPVNYAVGTYTLDFKVTDQCLNDGTGTLTILVNNTSPVFTNTVKSFNVREDINIETKIMQTTVTDKQTYTCAKKSASPEDTSFLVKQVSGSTTDYGIYLLAGKAHPNTLNYDTKPQYTIVVICTDALGLSSEETFTINMIRNNPPIINALPTEVSKSTRTTTSGTLIYKVDATDTDGGTLEYTMTCFPTGCPFTMNKQTGEITANQDLNLHKVSPYEVYVKVYDGHRTSGPATLTVKLTEINDIPVISNLGVTSLTQTIDENSAVGTQVIDVDYTDSNVADPHTFSASFVPDTCSTMYKIGPAGKVNTLVALNYEDLIKTGLDICDLLVTVYDGRETSAAKRLRIVVNDVNEQQTGFKQSLYSITADEGQAGKVIENPNFVVYDVDNNDVQKFTMDCGTRQSYFSMDELTGVITQTREYDLDAANQKFNIAKCTVTATDKALHTVKTQLEIRIEEINDNPPVLNKNNYYYAVSKYAAPGTTMLGQCTSTDADVKPENKLHTYSVDGSVVKVTDICNIMLTADLSGYPAGTQFVQTLTTTDIGGLTDTATVTIVVTDPPTTLAVTMATVNNNNNGGSGSGTGTVSGKSGSPAAFLDSPTNLAWFIPAVIAAAAALGLAGYMIYRCCRTPGFCGRLFNDMCSCFNNRDCCGRGGKRGSAKITDVKQARKDNAATDKTEPQSRAKKVEKPQKPINIREPAKIEGKYDWNLWSKSDFSNAKIEYR